MHLAACAEIIEPLWSEVREVTGVVQAIDRPDVICSRREEIGDAPAGNPEQRGYALTISDGATTMKVDMYLPWRQPIVKVGDTVTVSYHASFHFESAPYGWVMLRDEAGELLFWITMTHEDLLEVRPPEVVLYNGDATCVAKQTSCSAVTEGPVVAADAFTTNSERISIDQGAMADVGELVVINGESTRGAACGWAEARAVVAVVRGSRASLARDVQDSMETEEDAGL